MTTAHPDLDEITARNLRDDEQLKVLYLEAVRRRYWPNSSAAALEFATYAEKALQDDSEGTPGKLFYALVKRKDGSMVTDAQETRAQRRWPSHVRQELVTEAKALVGTQQRLVTETGELQSEVLPDVGYAHAAMMQCFLPQRPIEAARHFVSHGRASLVVESGILINPTNPDEWTECQIPAGPKPRLILPYVVGEAIRNASPEIDLGRSLRRFMERLGTPVSGSNGKALTAQVMNLAAATIIIGQWKDDRARMIKSPVADEVSFWIERDPAQLTLWTPTMTLSDRFYRAVQEHRVPVNMEHLVKLSRSPRRMDLYSWLSYRTPRVRPRGRVPVNLHALWTIFGPDISEFRNFKLRLVRDLLAIAHVYPDFNAEIDGDILWLRRSRPPVPYRSPAVLAPP